MCWKTVKHHRVGIFFFFKVDKKTASSVSSSEIIDTFLEREIAPHRDDVNDVNDDVNDVNDDVNDDTLY